MTPEQISRALFLPSYSHPHQSSQTALNGAMATDPTSGIDLQNLSCNWKKLQATLKTSERKKTTPFKRKRPFGELDSSKVTQAPFTKRHDAQADGHASRQQSESTAQSVKSQQHPSQPSSSSLASWAKENDIPAIDIAAAYGDSSLTDTQLNDIQRLPEHPNEGLSPSGKPGRYIALDCEMVGVGPNPDKDSALARVSMVNFSGGQVYDSFVQPGEKITDYRSSISGITKRSLDGARSFDAVQADIRACIRGRILVGHAIWNDLDALKLPHPWQCLRDTSKHKPYQTRAGTKRPSLRKLASTVLGWDIQKGKHSSVEDARAAMMLYRRDKDEFERASFQRFGAVKLKADGQAKGTNQPATVDENGRKSKKRKRRPKR